MRALALILLFCACGAPAAEPVIKTSEQALVTGSWPPDPFPERISIPAGSMSLGDSVIIRAALYVESLSGGPGSFVFTPVLESSEVMIPNLTTAEVPLSYPEYDHVFLEWVLHLTTSGQAVVYGTITATDINQGTTIRGGYRDIDFDPSLNHDLLIGVGRTSGPGVIRARLLSFTVK